MDLIIDPEFEAYLPAPDEVTDKQLEDSILASNILDPVRVWKGHKIIVDGHRRYKMSKRLKKPFRVEELEFADREEVKLWMRRMQFGRRNMTPTERKGYLSDAYKYAASKRPENEKGEVAEEVAKAHGTTARSVYRAHQFTEALKSLPAEIQERIRKSEFRVAQGTVVELANLPDADHQRAVSVWLTEQFMREGVNWCHVDATDAVVDGVRAKLNRALWEEILKRYVDGDIKGISSRFKCREGLDLPSTYHCVLATPIGSLASYIQTVGRALRYSKDTPDNVLITDHGGNYLQHGSPNHDRPWDLWWRLPEHALSNRHTDGIRDHGEPEPIRCPKCEGERKHGSKCPHCGHEHAKSQRHVIQADGSLKVVDGRLVPPRKVQKRSMTEQQWSKMFWGYRKKGVQASFNQMYAYFVKTHHYHPPRDLPLMPTDPEGWYRKPCDVEMNDLVAGRKEQAA